MLGFFKSSFEKVKGALSKTKNALGCKLAAIFAKGIDEESFDEIERVLYEADFGPKVAARLTEKLQTHIKSRQASPEEILAFLREEIKGFYPAAPLKKQSAYPHVVLLVGANGNGKTTTIAKLANLYKQSGKKVLLIAGDTFRAAATEQLKTWAEKLQLDIVTGYQGSDPSAVVFDGITAAKTRQADVALIDTAGRLPTKAFLMQEMQKIKKVCDKALSGAPHDTFLVIDSSYGQNALDQALLFHASIPLTGLIVTKLDGTAKGGIALAISEKLQLPIVYIGVGEGVEDLQPFVIDDFVKSIF